PDAAEELFKALGREKEPGIRVFLIDAIMATRHPDAAHFLAPSIHDSHLLVRRKVLGELAKLGAAANGVWADALSSPHPEVRARALRVLGRQGDKTRLKESLADPDPGVRLEAALTLASVGDPAGTPPLAVLLEREPKSRERFR